MCLIATLYDCWGGESVIATCHRHLAGVVLELRYRRIVMVIGLCWFGKRMSSLKGREESNERPTGEAAACVWEELSAKEKL